MKRALGWFGLLSLLVVRSALGAGAIVFVPMGDTDTAMVETVRAFVEEQTRLATRAAPERALVEGSLDVKGEAVADTLGDDDLMAIVVVTPEAGVSNHAVVLPRRRVAVINASAMKPDDDSPETWRRRLDRQAMRGVAFLLGVKPCPYPRCALCDYRSLEELDNIGRNLCPPCQDKLADAAKAHKAKPAPESPR